MVVSCRIISKRWQDVCRTSADQHRNQPPIITRATNLDTMSLNTIQEITKIAFESCTVENEIATFIKTAADQALGPNWQCIVGRNFGSHIIYQYYTYLTWANITVILFKCC